jgi:hypothetical protein
MGSNKIGAVLPNQIKRVGGVGRRGAWELGLKNVCRCSVDINIKNYKEFSDITKSI